MESRPEMKIPLMMMATSTTPVFLNTDFGAGQTIFLISLFTSRKNFPEFLTAAENLPGFLSFFGSGSLFLRSSLLLSVCHSLSLRPDYFVSL